MAKKVQYYDPNTFEFVESQREYEVYLFSAVQEAYDKWDHDTPVTLRLHVDELTGIATTAVAAYERSMK